MEGAERDGFEDQHVQGALKEFELFFVHDSSSPR
jgi:hypothetical protein